MRSRRCRRRALGHDHGIAVLAALDRAARQHEQEGCDLLARRLAAEQQHLVLGHGLLLNADRFLAFDWFDRRAVAHALAAGVEALARERHCAAIHTSLIPTRDTAPAGGGLVDVLCTRGHRIETLGMCKLLPPRSPARAARAQLR